LKKWFIAAAGFCVIVLLVVALVIVARGGNNDNSVYVYHFNPITRRLEAEARPMVAGDSLINSVIEHIHLGPLSDNLVTTWPHELAPMPEDMIQAVVLEDSMLLAFFKPVFHYMAPLEQTLFKAAFVHTMESLVERAFPHVSDIKMLVGEDYQYAFEMLMMGLLAEEDEDIPEVPGLIYDGSLGIYNDPFLSRAMMAPHTFNLLFFVDDTGTGLIIESWETEEVDHHLEERARYALGLLISGFRPEGAIFPIPQETVIHNVTIDAPLGNIFVDLSADFMNRFVGGSDMAELMIYSIVNTLTSDAFPITRVHFMIDTRQHENFHGVTDFHLPFEYDDTFLLSYIQEREERAADEAALESQ